MESFGIKDLIYFLTIGAGAVAYVVSSRSRVISNEKKLKEIMEANRETIKRIEENHIREINHLTERLNNKKQLFNEFKESIHKDVEELKKCATKCLDHEKAEAKFVTKAELKLLFENMDLKFTTLEKKIDDLITTLKGKG